MLTTSALTIRLKKKCHLAKNRVCRKKRGVAKLWRVENSCGKTGWFASKFFTVCLITSILSTLQIDGDPSLMSHTTSHIWVFLVEYTLPTPYHRVIRMPFL